ncbi:MAG: hypothetical protein Q9169_004817, partial [Polycauliona sp. 2 TL-2023]
AMRVVLEQLRNEWFDFSYDPNNLQTWVATDALKEVHNLQMKKKAGPAPQGMAIAKEAASQLGWEDEASALLVQATTKHTGLPPPQALYPRNPQKH